MEKQQMQLVALPVYREFISIMNYYRKDYDYFKYGLSKCNISTFEKRGDWNLFWRLLERFPNHQSRIALFAANLHDKNCMAMHLGMNNAIKEQAKFLKMQQDPVNTFMTLFGDVMKEHYKERLDEMFKSDESFKSSVCSMGINEVAFFDAVTGCYSQWVEDNGFLGFNKETIDKVSKFFLITKDHKQQIVDKIKAELKGKNEFADLLSK